MILTCMGKWPLGLRVLATMTLKRDVVIGPNIWLLPVGYGVLSMQMPNHSTPPLPHPPSPSLHWMQYPVPPLYPLPLLTPDIILGPLPPLLV